MPPLRWSPSTARQLWHKRASGEDAGAMVLNELIPMLDSQSLDTSRVAFLG